MYPTNFIINKPRPYVFKGTKKIQCILCISGALVHHQCMLPHPDEIRDELNGYVMLPYIFSKTSLDIKPQNCNSTWIPPNGTTSINIVAENMYLPFPQMNVPSRRNDCDNGKLVINVTNHNGTLFSCAFCGTNKFNISFSNAASVSFDTKNLPEIEKLRDLGSECRLRFQGKISDN